MFILLGTIGSTTAQTAIPAIIEQCAGLLAAERPTTSGENAPTIHIVSPHEDEVIYGTEVAITVETRHFDLRSQARHWHLWVNGELMGMVYQATGIIDLEPGTYQICASLGDTDHADIGMPDGIMINVQQAAPGTPTPMPLIAREDARVLAEPDVESPQIVLIVAIGLLAAAGGWWLGSRLARSHK